MEIKTIGFFTDQSAKFWFLEHGHSVKIFGKKQMKPKGEGFPHLIVKMELPEELIKTLYPEGKIMEFAFENYNGRLLP